MKTVFLIIAISLITACSVVVRDPTPEDRDSSANQTACIDTYNDVNSACANSITPHTY